jgi:hypothetical protein
MWEKALAEPLRPRMPLLVPIGRLLTQPRKQSRTQERNRWRPAHTTRLPNHVWSRNPGSCLAFAS